MNSQITAKITTFTKHRLVELFGVLLMLGSVFLLASIITYSPSDPNFIYEPESVKINNVGGFYGSTISDFLLQSIGLISILFVTTLFFWGLKLVGEKKINNLSLKFFFTLIYIIFGALFINIFYNDSFWLIDNGNSGFAGRIIKENIYKFTTLIENKYVVYCIGLIAFTFFIFSLNLKINQLTKIITLP